MRKKYPSQIRYEKNNPTITIRMKKAEKEKIQQLAQKAGKNISTLVRTSLLESQKNFSATSKKSYDQGKQEGITIGQQIGYKEGYSKGSSDWAIWIECWKCRKTLFIKPNSEDHLKTMVEMQGRLSHDTCPKD